MPAVPGFLPSQNGLRFVNAWPTVPLYEAKVPALGTVPIGNASGGLCGGMVFTVRDVFEFGLPPLQDGLPDKATPLFDYIVRRLFDSFHIPAGVLRYYAWMNTPDGDTDLGFAVVRGVAWKTAREEWPKVLADIDAGHPSPLGLVTVRSANPVDLGRNHQVLAYRYELFRGILTLHVYDPNTDVDEADFAFLRMSLVDPSHATTIDHNIGIADPIRGFFRVDYVPADPSALTHEDG